jgi:hypothetical protein
VAAPGNANGSGGGTALAQNRRALSGDDICQARYQHALATIFAGDHRKRSGGVSRISNDICGGNTNYNLFNAETAWRLGVARLAFSRWRVLALAAH